MHEPLQISVIFPVYNKVAYLRDSVDSVRVQEFDSFEIILVDDGSTDGSAELCEALAAEDGRIRVIHQENGGICKARNAGLRAAQGVYVCFPDCDDLVLEGYLASNYELAEREHADLVRSGRRRELTENGVCVSTNDMVAPSLMVFRGDEVYENWESIRSAGNSACYTLYRRSFLIENDIFFDERVRFGSEDAIFLYELFDHAPCVVLNPNIFYVWYQKAGEGASMRIQRETLDSLEISCAAVASFLIRHGIRERNPTFYSNEVSITWLNALLQATHGTLVPGGPTRLEFLKAVRDIYVRNNIEVDPENLSIPMRTAYTLLIEERYHALYAITQLLYFLRDTPGRVVSTVRSRRSQKRGAKA